MFIKWNTEQPVSKRITWTRSQNSYYIIMIENRPWKGVNKKKTLNFILMR